MEIEIGRGKKARRAYGFDDIAIVPVAAHPRPRRRRHLLEARPYRFELPLLASAMDGVVSPRDRRRSSAGSAAWPCSTSRASSPATRTPTSSSSGSRSCPRSSATREMQEIYHEPVKPELIAAADRGDQGAGRRRRGVADAAARARATTSSRSRPGLDILVIQGTVVSAEHVSADPERPPLNLKEFVARGAGARSSSAAVPATTRACT